MRKSFISINAYVHGANAHHGYVIGVPSLTSTWGWMHSVSLQAQKYFQDEDLSIERFTLAYKDFSLTGRASMASYLFDRKKGEMNAPIMERPKCSFELFVTLVVDHSDSTTHSELKEFILSKILGGRFAGGLLDIKTVEVFDEIKSAIMSVPQGFFFIETLSENNIGRFDKTGEFVEVDNEFLSGEEKLDLIYELCTKRQKYKLRDENSDASWYIPLVNGYVGVTDACERTFSRNGYKHLFAEPVVGIYRVKPSSAIKNSIRKLGDEALIDAVFVGCPADNSFFVTNPNKLC